MAGIKVEVKRGAKWFYVVADFGDGQPPVTKGPMRESEARQMAAELEQVPDDLSGVVVRDRSIEEARENRRAAFAFFGLLGAVLVVVTVLVLSWVGQ